MLFSTQRRELLQFGTITNTHEGERLMKETSKITKHFYPEKRVNIMNKHNSLVNIKFVAKTSNIRKLFQNIRSDVKTSEVATLPLG